MGSYVCITGATGGLGRAFAVECAERGWDLVLTDLSAEALANLATALSVAYDIKVRYYPCDLTDNASREAMPVKAIYAASKRFLLDFSLALREELRPWGGTVTTLCPAGMPTTAEVINRINAQGLMGWITTKNVGFVVARTLDHALKGHSVYIPGLVNRILRLMGGLVPPTLVAHLIGRRWSSAHQRTIKSLCIP